MLINKLVEKCSENIDGNEVIDNKTLIDYGKICGSCTIYIVLLAIFFIIGVKHLQSFYLSPLVFKNKYIATTIY